MDNGFYYQRKYKNLKNLRKEKRRKMEGMGRRRIRDNIWIMDFIIKQKRKRKKRRERSIWGGIYR